MPLITALAAARPAYGYRRITGDPEPPAARGELGPVDHKRVYRIMRIHNLLLARKYTVRAHPEHVHGRNRHALEPALILGRVRVPLLGRGAVRGAFLIDAHDREISAWRAG